MQKRSSGVAALLLQATLLVPLMPTTTHGIASWVDDSVRKTAACLMNQWGTQVTQCAGYLTGTVYSVADEEFLIATAGDTVYAVFQGAESTDLVSTLFGLLGNLNCGTNQVFTTTDGLPLFGGAAAFHEGLLDTWNAIRPSVLTQVGLECVDTCKLVLAGHSTGGTMATLASYQLMLEEGLTGLGHIAGDPEANMFVYTLGEPHSLVHSELQSSSDWHTISLYQNSVKERHVATGSIGTLGCTTNFDALVSGGLLCGMSGTGRLVVQCNGIGGGSSLLDFYLAPLFDLVSVDMLYNQCIGGQSASSILNQVCYWSLPLPLLPTRLYCQGVTGFANQVESQVVNLVNTWLGQPCPANSADL